MKKNNKGFTLAELLIVVAIIAVLVAIAIPIFSAQLEKSREATDLSNIRAAYAEAAAKYLVDGQEATATVTKIMQTQPEWQTSTVQLITRIDGTETIIDLKTQSDTKDIVGKTVTVTANDSGITVSAS